MMVSLRKSKDGESSNFNGFPDYILAQKLNLKTDISK